jgi:hypothetical protein
MVYKKEAHKRALELRIKNRLSNKDVGAALSKEGFSVAHSTLADWLKARPLAKEEYLQIIKDKNSYDPGSPSKYYDLVEDFGYKLSRKQKGKIAESAVLFRLNLFKVDVYASVFDGDIADWVIELPDKVFYKVQVRWCKIPKVGSPLVSLVSKDSRKEGEQHRRFTNNDFDFIVGYHLYSDTAYVWSFDETSNHKTTISVEEDAKEAWHKIFPKYIDD